MEADVKVIEGVYPVTVAEAVYIEPNKTLKQAIDDGSIGGGGTVTPLADQVSSVYLDPPILVMDGNSLKPITGQKIYVHFLSSVFKTYDLPALSLGANGTSIRLNPTTGAFRSTYDLYKNEITLLAKQNNKVIGGVLFPYLQFESPQNYRIITPKNYDFVNIGNIQLQSLAFIGEELWAFDKDIESSSIVRRDPVTFSAIGEKLMHDLGYWNSADYNSELDAIVAGNGTGFSTTEGIKATVYTNCSSWATMTDRLTTSNVQHIDIDLSGLNDEEPTFKVQACWGDSNLGKHNIIYIVTNDGRAIRKLFLGQGSNDLGNGVFHSGKNTTEFNGTYKVIDKWETADGGGNVQDIHYHDGVVYYNSKRSIEEGGLIVWANKLSLNGIIKKDKIFIPVYNERGELGSIGTGEGITIKDGKIYCVLLGSYFFTFDIPT